VEDPVLGIEGGLDVRHPPVVVDREVGDVAAGAAQVPEEDASRVRAVGRLTPAGREVVEQVELHVVDQALRDLDGDTVPIWIGDGVVGWGGLYRVLRA